MTPLFDIDWTLLKGGNAIHARASEYAFRTVWNVPATVDEIDHHGMTDRQIFYEVLRGRGISEADIADKWPRGKEAMEGYFAAHEHEGESVVLPGVNDTLARLKGRVACGILTGNTEAMAGYKLKRADIADHFSFGAFGDATTRRFELVSMARAAYTAKYGDDANVCIIGDSPRDIECAKLAGIPVVAVASGHYSKDALSQHHPDLTLGSLEESDALISFLFT